MTKFDNMTNDEIVITLEKGFEELNRRVAALNGLTGAAFISDWPLHDLLADMGAWDDDIPGSLEAMREQMGLDDDGMVQAVSDAQFDYHVAQAGWSYYA